MKKITIGLFLIGFICFSFNIPSKAVCADSGYWYRVWGGNGYDHCLDIALDSSNNIYLGGIFEMISDSGRYSTICLVKYDNTGIYQWNKTIGSSYRGGVIILDSSDNIFLAGEIYNQNSSTHDFILVKYDPSGNYQWNKTWDSGKNDVCYTIALDSLENIYLAGSSMIGSNDEDFCLVKYDNFGNYQWNRTWGGPYNDICWAIALDSSDNIYLAGNTLSYGAGGSDMCIVNFNSTGDFQWNKTWGSYEWDDCKAIVLDASENIYIAGSSSSEGYSDVSLVKYDKLGNYQWNRTWSGKVLDEECNSMLIDPSGNLYLAGTKGDQYCVVVYDTNGTFHWAKSLKFYQGGTATGVVRDLNGNIYVGGYIYKNTASRDDFLLIKNLHSFPDLQISGYNIFFLTMIIGMLSLVILLKTKNLKIEK
ncbi:MAG: SBBP repeat-containing protein [Candidatus Hermodarchaeota archaeon]